MKTGILAEPILIGREQELQELETYLNSAIDGKGKTVFVSGEAGSGKTRLTREFLNKAKKKEVIVMAGWCLSEAAAPYFPFVEAFQSYFAVFADEEQSSRLQPPGASLGLPETEQLIGGERKIAAWLTGPTSLHKIGRGTMSPQVWKDQVFAGVAKTLHEVSVQSPTVLFLEDMQWADSASLALLHYVSRAVNNSERVLVLATFRSEELTDDAEGHPHPFAETLRMMKREDLFTEIKLGNLNRAAVSRMAENMVGGSLQPELAERLAMESQGNALFVVELLRMLSERKSLVLENNEWRLAVDELGIPSKVRDIILRRLSILKYVQRRVLDAASVMGEKFDVVLLGAVLGQDVLEVLETLNVVAHSTSLVSVEENCYRFDHAKSREVLYEELSLPLKRGYHARIAEKLESAKGALLPLSDLAYHFAQAGEKEKAIKYALEAAKDELARFSNQQAIQHFTYALQNLPEGSDCGEQRRTAMEGLGDAYAANSMYGEAIKMFDELAASETGIVALRALRKATDAAYHKWDKPDLLIEYAKKAEELAAFDRLEMARIINNRGRAWSMSGRDPTLDLADFNFALQIFEEENSLADVADALWRSGTLEGITKTDGSGKGLDKLMRSAAIFKDLGDAHKEAEAALYMGVGFFGVGLLPESRTAFEHVLRIGEKLGVFAELSVASFDISILDEFEGRLADAMSHTLKQLEYEKKTDARSSGSALTKLYVKLGDMKHAEKHFEKSIKPLLEKSLGPMSFLYPIDISAGIYYAAKGQWEESKRFFERNADSLRARRALGSPAVGWELTFAANYAWALEKQGRFEKAKVQREEVQRLLEQVNEMFGRANVKLSVMAPREVQVGEGFEIRLDLVNVSRKSGLLVNIMGVIPPEFNVIDLPSFCSLQDSNVVMKDKSVGPFQVETVKLKLEATQAGRYTLNPELTYTNDLGTTKSFKADSITIAVQPVKPAYEAMAGRVTTGYADLDKLLLGGIPEKYAVALAAPSCNERALLLNRFLKAGAEAGETTFLITDNLGNAKALAEEHLSNFYVFLCNPRADAMIKNLPNVFKLKGVESLTEIDIALIKAFRTLNISDAGPKRICLEIISDTLLQHHAVTTRKWIGALVPDLKSKGFTILAVIDPLMHPAEEAQAVLGLFDGEIRLAQRENAKGMKKFLKIIKLYNQQYSEIELTITKENLA